MKTLRSLAAVVLVAVSSIAVATPHAAADERTIRVGDIEQPPIPPLPDTACFVLFVKSLIQGGTYCAPMP